MMENCNYCDSRIGDSAAGQCAQCGAPVSLKPRDYTLCPYCRRKLLAMASIACNYCGKALPPDYIQTRQTVARTIADQSKPSADGGAGLIAAAEAQDGSNSGLLSQLAHILSQTDI